MHVDWSLECAVLATSNMYNVPKLEKTNFISATLFSSSHVMFCCLENSYHCHNLNNIHAYLHRWSHTSGDFLPQKANYSRINS